MSNGIVLYEGPSVLDGAPIVVIATGLKNTSRNEKTGGGLIQTWILRADVKPTDAVNTGADASICGLCPHRGEVIDGRNVGRSCYVTVFQAPLNVWKTWKRGNYPKAQGNEFAGRGVRLGAYGDPAAVPFHVWTDTLADASFWTGYTHQWRDFPELAAFVMASCDSLADFAAAKMLGFRCFRVTTDNPVATKLAGEIVCPASEEMGRKTTCDACRACGGLGSKAKADVVIRVHGPVSKVNAAVRRIAA